MFEHYVKTRAEEERKEKRAAQKAAIEGFKLLLDRASEVISLSTLIALSYVAIFVIEPFELTLN